MAFEIVDRVSGLSDERLRQSIADAETGYDIQDLPIEPNPHFGRLQLVPSDLLDAIDRRATSEGATTEGVIRAALIRYLDSA